MAVRLSSDNRDLNPSIMYLGNVLRRKKYTALPFLLYTGQDIDVTARTQTLWWAMRRTVQAANGRIMRRGPGVC